MRKRLKKFFRFFVTPKPKPSDAPYPITIDQYYSDLSFDPRQPEELRSSLEKRAERAFEMVVETRKFEIELYWKRATYFWAFLVSLFAAYVALQKEGSDNAILLIIVLGFIVSIAWLLSNRGSKQWQRHWEKHLDLLEDLFVGPLYKTIYFTKTYSVSKLNDIVSGAVSVMWLVLAWDHLASSDILSFSLSEQPAFGVIGILLLGAVALVPMCFGYGRGRFKSQDAQMYRRRMTYDKKPVP